MNYNSTQGLDFARKAMALMATGGNLAEAVEFAAARWGSSSTPVAELQKSAVGALDSSDNSDALNFGSSAAEFLDVVHSLTILGRLQGLRRVAMNVPIVLQQGTATAYWVGEAKGIPMSRNAFTRSRMRTLKIAAITAFSEELVRGGSSRAVASIRDDLVEAGVRLMDRTFIEPENGGSASMPASITHGLTKNTSTGDLADDVEVALAAFTGNLRSASWVMSPRTAAQAGIRSGGKGIAADLGALGGTLAGLPVLTSESVPLTSDGSMIALVDASSIAVVEEDPTVALSTSAMIEQDTAPAGAIDTPAAASATKVSMFQEDSVAAKMVLRANWLRTRDGAVVVIEGANYSAT